MYITDMYEAYCTYVDDKYFDNHDYDDCLLYTSPSPRDYAASRMPSSA